MPLWSNTVTAMQWLRSAFRRVAPTLATATPWIGGALLIIASAFAAHSWRFAHAHVRNTATITENITAFAPEGGILYYPRLRFRTHDGEIVQVLAGPGTEDIDFPAGETVPVLYPAGHPQLAIIATAWRIYHAAILFGLWGTALFDLGWALRIMMRKRTLSAELA